MSWRYVISDNYQSAGSGITDFYRKVVIPSGYDFFTWNGDVYKVINDHQYKQTSLTVKDLF